MERNSSQFERAIPGKYSVCEKNDIDSVMIYFNFDMLL